MYSSWSARNLPSLSIQGQRALDLDVARLEIGEEGFATRGIPFHRPPDTACRPGQHGIFGIDRRTHAEAAADIAGDHAHLVHRHAETRGDGEFDAVNALAHRMDGVAIARAIVFAEGDARLHRRAADALITRGQAHDAMRARESGVSRRAIAIRRRDQQIAGAIFPERRRARRQRRGRIDRGGQRRVIDRDQLGGVLRGSETLGDDESGGFADIAHAIQRDRRLQGRRAVRHRLGAEGGFGDLEMIGTARSVRHTFEAGRGVIFSGQHREHARCLRCGCRIDAGNVRMRMRRAQHGGVGLMRKIDIVGEAAFSGQQPPVFLAPDRLSDQRGHGVKPARRHSLFAKAGSLMRTKS